MNSRPMVLVFLLLILIITSQFEWKQQLVAELDSTTNVLGKQQRVAKKEVVKEKIILIQEKEIQQLKDQLRSLRQQLQQCQRKSNMSDTLTIIPDGNERQDILIDVKHPIENFCLDFVDNTWEASKLSSKLSHMQ